MAIHYDTNICNPSLRPWRSYGTFNGIPLSCGCFEGMWGPTSALQERHIGGISVLRRTEMHIPARTRPWPLTHHLLQGSALPSGTSRQDTDNIHPTPGPHCIT